MGDGIFDHLVMSKVGYSIAPRNADANAKLNASYITEREGRESSSCRSVFAHFRQVL